MAGIYIHIPFCRHKCNYCNFFSIASIKEKPNLVQAIVQEALLRKDYLKEENIQSIYFGGGTPSLLEQKEIDKLLDVLFANYNVDRNCEITFEANPDDLVKSRLKELKKSAINRLSIGVQSFRQEDLDYLERTHNSDRVKEVIQNTLQAGFENLSIDLIYGIPTLSNRQWEENLKQFLSLEIPHLSAYALTVEPRTVLAWQIEKNKTKQPDDQQASDQFELLMDFADTCGLEHYEISNFAFDQQYSRHNTSYWFNELYMGLGPSAHSYNRKSRQWNASSVSHYIHSLSNGTLPFEKEELNSIQNFNERILTQIRTIWGINTEELKIDFPELFAEFQLNLSSLSNPEWIQIKEKHIQLSRKGKIFADRVSSELFIA